MGIGDVGTQLEEKAIWMFAVSTISHTAVHAGGQQVEISCGGDGVSRGLACAVGSVRDTPNINNDRGLAVSIQIHATFAAVIAGEVRNRSIAVETAGKHTGIILHYYADVGGISQRIGDGDDTAGLQIHVVRRGVVAQCIAGDDRVAADVNRFVVVHVHTAAGCCGIA